MKILYKYPTRDRQLKFQRCLDRYYDYISDLDNSEFIISLDSDDSKMNCDPARQYMDSKKNLKYFYGNNTSKIMAINADIPATDWDIVVLISDDMIPEIPGFDQIIREKMKEHYPDTDGILWFFDGWRRDLNTLCILGRKYYDRFGYIYHPSYKSFWSDAEFTDVGTALNKQTFIDKVIIRHIHPDIVLEDKETRMKFAEYLPEYAQAGSHGHDFLWKKNSLEGDPDHKIYLSRKAAGFR
jgi:hypothetical protein